MVGRCKSFNAETHTVELEDLFAEGAMLNVNAFQVKGKIIEVGTNYEFMGEIKPSSDGSEEVFLEARILKKTTGFNKKVYQETTMIVNGLIEAITTRNQSFRKKQAEDKAAD